MCKQNSSVINSIWTWQQRFLHTGVQRFLRNPAPCTTFWKSRGKLTKKKKWTKLKRTTPSTLDHVRSTKQKKRHTRTTYDAHQLNPARITASKHAEETTFKERRFQHTERHAEQRRWKRTTLTQTHSPRQGSQNQNAERTTLKGETTLPEQSKRRQKQNVNKRFQETATGTTT